jgi:hypothetical protein
MLMAGQAVEEEILAACSFSLISAKAETTEEILLLRCRQLPIHPQLYETGISSTSVGQRLSPSAVHVRSPERSSADSAKLRGLRRGSIDVLSLSPGGDIDQTKTRLGITLLQRSRPPRH